MTYLILRTHTGKDVAVIKAEDIQYVYLERGRLMLSTKDGQSYRFDMMEPTDKVN